VTGAGPTPAAAALDARVVARHRGFTLDVTIAAVPGEVLAVLGPNGAGKSTLLRGLAGLVPLAAGYVRLGAQVLDDVPAGRHTPAEHRGIGVVFQDYLLFPHLTALDNVAYGLRTHGLRRPAARREALRWLDRVGLADHAGKRPRQLSGGQAQRVALARALILEPRLLLLDEPLAALDAGTRLRLRTDLRRHLTSYGRPAIVVTHDAVEAMVLADRLVVLERGRIVQEGAPADVARHPRSDYVASLVGVNLYRGTAHDGRIDLDGGGALVSGASATTGPVHVALRPSAVALHRQPPTPGSPRNTWTGTITGLEAVGDRIRVAVSGTPPVFADITPAAAAELRLATADRVWLTVKASELVVYPTDPDTGDAGADGRRADGSDGRDRGRPAT
jgi:molybdate transport system ATP-binding protein